MSRIALDDLQQGQLALGNDGHYYRKGSSGYWYDELGRNPFIPKGKQATMLVEVCQPPVLMVGDVFTFIGKKSDNVVPGMRLLFQMGCGYRFVVSTGTYTLSLGAHFQSTDARIDGLASAGWRGDSGQLISAIMQSSQLRLDFNDAPKPKLVLTIWDSLTSWRTVVSK